MEYKIDYGPAQQDAMQKFGQLQKQRDEFQDRVTEALGDHSEGSVALGVVGAFLWMGAYVAFFFIAKPHVPVYLLLPSTLCGVLLCILMIIKKLRIRTHNDILYQAQEKANTIDDQLSRAKQDMEKVTATPGSASGLDKTFSKESINEKLTGMMNDVSDYKTLKTGGISKLIDILYYATVMLMTAAASVLLYGIVGPVVRFHGIWDYSDTIILIMAISLTVLCSIVTVTVAVYVRSENELQEVRVLYLFFSLAGFLLFPAALVILKAVLWLVITVVIFIGKIIIRIGRFLAGIPGFLLRLLIYCVCFLWFLDLVNLLFGDFFPIFASYVIGGESLF